VSCGTTCIVTPTLKATTGITSPVIQLTTGAGAGRVLTSDADGNASWCIPFVGTTCLCGLTGDVSIINPQLNQVLVYDNYKWININNVTLDCIAAGTCLISPIISGITCVETPRYKSAATLAMCAAAGCNAVVMNGSEFFICALANSSVSLYYNNAEKLKTLSTGLCACGCVWATDFVASSDCRCKKEIMPIYNAISVVDRLQGVYYKLCNDTSEKCRMGMIAQNVAKVVPEVVYTAEDGMLGIDYAKLVPVLVEAIHQLQKEITNIKTYGY